MLTANLSVRLEVFPKPHDLARTEQEFANWVRPKMTFVPVLAVATWRLLDEPDRLASSSVRKALSLVH